MFGPLKSVRARFFRGGRISPNKGAVVVFPDEYPSSDADVLWAKFGEVNGLRSPEVVVDELKASSARDSRYFCTFQAGGADNPPNMP